MAEIQKNQNLEWARAQIENYIRLYPRYQAYNEVLRRVLEKAAAKYAPLAIVQTRPKSISGFADKMLRKRAQGRYTDAVNRITDLCGGRVITPTLSEVKSISEFIETHFDIDWDNSVDVGQRLKPVEFGYRAIHYVVELKRGVFPTKDIDIKIPEEVYGLKAEIQVKTILEHAWGVFTHDRAYKGAFKIPQKWEREMAHLAAVLEGVDNSFARIQNGLERYAASYGAYMTEAKMRDETEYLKLALEYDPNNAELAARIGKLALALGDWQMAMDVLRRHVDSGYQPVLRDLGVALCKLYRANPDSQQYKQGQKYLEAASALSNRDSDALASLAGTWKGIDEDRARELYRQAFEADPSDPYPLGNYLEYEVTSRRDTSLASLMRPVIEAAIRRSRDQADVGMNLPWAFYNTGRFYLLMGMPYDSIAAYAKAVQLSTASFMIDTSLLSIEKLDVVRAKLQGYDWLRRLLLVGLAVKSQSQESIKRVEKLTSTSHKLIRGPVIVVAGGNDISVEKQIQDYRQLVLEAFRDFKGTVISGGTTAGVSGLAGELGNRHPDAVRTIGYLPSSLPDGVAQDSRYNEIRRTDGDGFSPLEPLQYWVDIIVSGISPSQVKLLGINGGTVAAAEYRIALSLGARVAVLEGSGGEAAKLVADNDWADSKGLLRLSAEATTIEAFVGLSNPELDPEIRETIARAIHENFRGLRARNMGSEDPAMAEWDRLRDDLKESNLQQADDVSRKLRRIGCAVHKVVGRDVASMTFAEDEIQVMAEMEHARWNVERLLAGWTWAEKRDPIRKTSPYLVGWLELPEDVKEWDRETVRKIPEFLAGVGLGIRRLI